MSVNKKTLTLAFVCSGKVFLTNPSHAPGGSRPSGCPLCTVWKPPSGKPGTKGRLQFMDWCFTPCTRSIYSNVGIKKIWCANEHVCKAVDDKTGMYLVYGSFFVGVILSL